MAAASSALTVIITYTALMYQALLMFRAYAEVVAQGPDLVQPPRPIPTAALRRGIELDDVWFRYGPDEPWVLRGVSFFIPCGQAVAVVGHNGAGKSTLVKLMCRFYDPDRGRILWDGTDLRGLDLAELRDRISAVFQDFMTYELSAADNIAVGDLSQAGSSQTLTAAARQAGIHQALTALPNGYDTLLTRTYYDLADRDNPQTGVLLSGGQWQRLGLARAHLAAARWATPASGGRGRASSGGRPGDRVAVHSVGRPGLFARASVAHAIRNIRQASPPGTDGAMMRSLTRGVAALVPALAVSVWVIRRRIAISSREWIIKRVAALPGGPLQT